MSISWAESTLAEAIAPAPARIFRKKPRLLLMFPPSSRISENKISGAACGHGPTESEMICAEQKKRLFEGSLDTNGNENRLETTDVRRGIERRESFTLDRGKRRAGGRLSYVKLGNCVIIGRNSR